MQNHDHSQNQRRQFDRWEEAAHALSSLPPNVPSREIDSALRRAGRFIREIPGIHDFATIFSPCQRGMRLKKAALARALAAGIRARFLPFTRIQQKAVDALKAEFGGRIEIAPDGTATFRPSAPALAKAVREATGRRCTSMNVKDTVLDIDAMAIVSSASKDHAAVIAEDVLRRHGIHADPVPAKIIEIARRLAGNREWRLGAFAAADDAERPKPKRSLAHPRNAVVEEDEA